MARETNLTRHAIQKMLSDRGNPRLSSVESILTGLGNRLALAPMKSSKKRSVKKTRISGERSKTRKAG